MPYERVCKPQKKLLYRWKTSALRAVSLQFRPKLDELEPAIDQLVATSGKAKEREVLNICFFFNVTKIGIRRAIALLIFFIKNVHNASHVTA